MYFLHTSATTVYSRTLWGITHLYFVCVHTHWAPQVELTQKRPRCTRRQQRTRVNVATVVSVPRDKSPAPGVFSRNALLRLAAARRGSQLAQHLSRLVPLYWRTTTEFTFSTVLFFFNKSPDPHMKRTWLSGGWRKWTPAGRRMDPHPRTTFISPRQSQTAAGRWTRTQTPRRFTTTRLWLIREGRCPETSKR